ncbi:hypothetical protein DFH09DRAFT_1279009 [Mycena vulgaris]|nr:hypothetical protein DFH09DRAFT_1279009 [Mycena vulgaris]
MLMCSDNTMARVPRARTNAGLFYPALHSPWRPARCEGRTTRRMQTTAASRWRRLRAGLTSRRTAVDGIRQGSLDEGASSLHLQPSPYLRALTPPLLCKTSPPMHSGGGGYGRSRGFDARGTKPGARGCVFGERELDLDGEGWSRVGDSGVRDILALATRRHATQLAIAGGAVLVLVLILLRGDWTTARSWMRQARPFKTGTIRGARCAAQTKTRAGERVQERARSPATVRRARLL